jgi:hypothetical protein
MSHHINRAIGGNTSQQGKDLSVKLKTTELTSQTNTLREAKLLDQVLEAKTSCVDRRGDEAKGKWDRGEEGLASSNSASIPPISPYFLTPILTSFTTTLSHVDLMLPQAWFSDYLPLTSHVRHEIPTPSKWVRAPPRACLFPGRPGCVN